MESPEHEARQIRLYVEGQTDEQVTELEKIASERVLGETHDVWDVRTDKGRWWVVTGLTNLYQFDTFPSMDQVLSFHVGLTARVAERQRKEIPEDKRYRLPGAWRRFSQAVDGYNAANEAEEFQAVAMRLRECLLAFIRDVADERLVPEGRTPPKIGDFLHWSELIAESISKGRLRTYLKSMAVSTWELIQSLTHNVNATRFDAEIALDSAGHLLGTFSLALIRHEQGMPDRCPECGSYRVVADFRPEANIEPPFVNLCASCGWEEAVTSPDDSA
jgi:hypothetical protein